MTLDEVLEKTDSFDLIFFDGNHNKIDTLNYFNKCLKKRDRMSKKDQRKKSLKTRRRDQVRWLSSITSVLVIIIAVWLFWESSSENHDLTLIGQGTNVVVQVHDPG